MTPPPFLPNQRKTDEDQLNLIAIFHFVGAGFAVLAILFLLLHFAIFQTVFSNPGMWEHQKETPPPEVFAFFKIFRWFYLVMGLWFLASCVLNILAGLYLRKRLHRTFSLVVGAVNCLHIPLGTILGVFTLIILCRDSVRELYEAHSPHR